MSSGDSAWMMAAYLVATVLFILGLKKLSRPRSAVRGNQLGAAGMLVAVLATVIGNGGIGLVWIICGMALGAAIGVLAAAKVQMTAMPELVALFNGFGGGASMLVAMASHTAAAGTGGRALQASAATALATTIGAITLTGSMVAFAKLRGRLRALGFPAVRVASAAMASACAALGVLLTVDLGDIPLLWPLAAVSALLGAAVVLPIGGADMPVVIALLNSFSGVAAVAAGFVLDNRLLIVAGALVGASGLILTRIMCVSMNRSLPAVMFGAAPAAKPGDADDVYEGKVRSTSAEDVAMLLETAGSVVIVPGYGLAVAQAQHAVRDLAQKLDGMGVEVLFGIHPVAGRMPGHMNVLLAEAEIDYEHLLTMDEVNPMFEQTDVAIVLGANDVVNPSARTDSSSPIAGMPILDVDRSRVVVVIKRSLSPGFAGIANPLFTADNALLLFSDGREAVIDITRALEDRP